MGKANGEGNYTCTLSQRTRCLRHEVAMSSGHLHEDSLHTQPCCCPHSYVAFRHRGLCLCIDLQSATSVDYTHSKPMCCYICTDNALVVDMCASIGKFIFSFTVLWILHHVKLQHRSSGLNSLAPPCSKRMWSRAEGRRKKRLGYQRATGKCEGWAP